MVIAPERRSALGTVDPSPPAGVLTPERPAGPAPPTSGRLGSGASRASGVSEAQNRRGGAAQVLWGRRKMTLSPEAGGSGRLGTSRALLHPARNTLRH